MRQQGVRIAANVERRVVLQLEPEHSMFRQLVSRVCPHDLGRKSGGLPHYNRQTFLFFHIHICKARHGTVARQPASHALLHNLKIACSVVVDSTIVHVASRALLERPRSTILLLETGASCSVSTSRTINRKRVPPAPKQKTKSIPLSTTKPILLSIAPRSLRPFS
jgi:hypothetical protein